MPCSTRPSATLYLALVLAAAWQGQAVNDWSVPCIGGECSWDLPADSSSSGSIYIWGPTHAISDLTPASGWKITSCDPIATTQDIRLICEDDNLNCGHVFEGGAENTVVRLPESCGSGPFARVARHGFILPSSDNGVQTHVMSLDANFSAIRPSQIHFSLWGANMRGANYMTSSAWKRHWRTMSHDGPHANIDRRNVLDNELNARKPEDRSLFNKSLVSQPILFSGSTTLLDMSIQCPGNVTPSMDPTASVVLKAAANVNATVGLFAVVSGTFPNISKFYLHFGLDGTIDANLSVRANVSGQLGSISATLFELGIPGLTFPNILEIGPEFKVSSEIDANLKVSDIEASVDFKYDLSGVNFDFPPQPNSQFGAFKRGTSYVTAYTKPDVGLTYDVTGHLTPEIDIGLTAFGIISSGIFVNLDASTDVTIVTSTAHDAQACLSASTTLDVGVGARASFFDIFGASVGESLFTETFPLVQNVCFGPPSGGSTSTSIAASPSHNGRGIPRPPPPLTNTAPHGRGAPRSSDAPFGRSVVPAQPRAGILLLCPLPPSNVSVGISLTIP